MSGRRRQTLSPSLFPFLAVLVCTLGTLILLLALVARNSSQAAQQRAQQVTEPDVDQDGNPRPTTEDVAELIEDEQFRIDALVDVRDEQTADLENRRDQLAHLEDHIRRLREQIKTINDQVVRASSDKQDSNVDELLIEKLKQDLKSGQEEIEKLRRESKDQTPRVVIVPHKGPNGTDRRPIYVECDSEGITIWPEGVKIPLINLQESTRGANPLDAALRVVRLRALKDYGDATSPYPMLIVRPDGVLSYGAARQAMKDWDDQFGYELVPGEVELAYAQPDRELKQRMEYAIRQAVIEQHGLNAIAQRAFGGAGGSGRLRRGQSGAGSTRQSLPPLSAAQMDRNGRSSGFRDHRAPVGSRYSGNFGSVGGDGSSFAAGTGAQAAQKLDERLRQAAESISGADGSAGGLVSGPSPSISGPTAVDQIGRGANGRSADELASGAPEFSSALENPSMTPSEQRVASADLNSAGWKHAGTQSGETQNSESESSPMSLVGPSGSNGLASQSAQQSSLPSNSSNAPSMVGALPNQNSSAPGGSASSGSQMMPPQDAPPVDASQVPNSFNASATTQSPGSQPVRRGGSNWALPREVAASHGNAIVRTIRVQCHADHFVLVPSARSNERAQTFSFTDGEINRATLELATAVRDRIQQWGAALPGGRWQPRLEVEVMERGDHRFHQLRTLMSGSGVEIDRSNQR